MPSIRNNGAKNRDYQIVVIGPGAVGKSALTIQFIQNQFMEYWDPTIQDNYRKHVVLDGKQCWLDITDTAGQEEFDTLQDQFIRAGEGFLLVFDVNNPDTFERVFDFYEKVKRVKGETEIKDIPIILVGNKCDLPIKLDMAVVEDKARRHELTFRKTSAKEGTGVDDIFYSIARLIKKYRAKASSSTSCKMM